MIDEVEIRGLQSRLEKFSDFIADYGSDNEFNNDAMEFANNICDALSWVIGEISTDDFKSEAYLNMLELETVANNIEDKVWEEAFGFRVASVGSNKCRAG